MMKPEPSELTRRGAAARVPFGLPSPAAAIEEIDGTSSSSWGVASGACAYCWPPRAPTFWEVEMLTTASMTCSATSATASVRAPATARPGPGNTMRYGGATNTGWRSCRANRPIMPSMNVNSRECDAKTVPSTKGARLKVPSAIRRPT